MFKSCQFVNSEGGTPRPTRNRQAKNEKKKCKQKFRIAHTFSTKKSMKKLRAPVDEEALLMNAQNEKPEVVVLGHRSRSSTTAHRRRRRFANLATPRCRPLLACCVCVCPCVCYSFLLRVTMQTQNLTVRVHAAEFLPKLSSCHRDGYTKITSKPPPVVDRYFVSRKSSTRADQNNQLGQVDQTGLGLNVNRSSISCNESTDSVLTCITRDDVQRVEDLLVVPAQHVRLRVDDVLKNARVVFSVKG